MAKITLSEPDGPYKCQIDTDVMTVEIRDAFLGVKFITEDGEHLSVCMRDSGFEVHYSGNHNDDDSEKGFDSGWISFNNSFINKLTKDDNETPQSMERRI